MASVNRSQIEHPSALTPAALPCGKDDLVRTLSALELAGFDTLLASTRGRPIQSATRADFDTPPVTALLGELRETIMHGRGVVIVRGISPERYDREAMERIWWGIGTHLGIATVQSQSGDRLGYVEEDEDNPRARGYRSAGELNWHTDSTELIGLMCVRKGASGGLSGLASTLAIHNEIARTRPDLLEHLYEGYYYAIPELQFTNRPITDKKIPIFCNVDGVVSCMYAGSFMRSAAEKRGEPLPAGLAEALDLFETTAKRPDMHLRFMLEPGEMMLWHNFLFLHSRTHFENSPTQKRLLLRHWLDVPDGRPVRPEILERANAYKWAYRNAGKPPAATST